ncbi:hypothetical protein GCM10027413_07550 [Conyzicola nivalis]|uniref:Iron-binding zinc finger CDGSH type domain-containing protein n=1 Tax=Conyzicola nivalis TaxID=1477021 RepID=A0A916WJS0_9MICO|nr:CDGSH iron-sulfur domain-containing protein [Conyzicola nivalis]GGB04562.1 hypothetical protein GCM10010979_19080 [Conyzicola nivalis]
MHSDERVTITPYENGPLIVRGDFEILDADGVPVPPGRKTVALCRCGVSAIKPFCDGTHKLVGFKTGEDQPA